MVLFHEILKIQNLNYENLEIYTPWQIWKNDVLNIWNFFFPNFINTWSNNKNCNVELKASMVRMQQ